MKITSQRKFPEYIPIKHLGNLVYFFYSIGACYIRNPKCASTSTIDHLINNFPVPTLPNIIANYDFHIYDSSHNKQAISFLKKYKIFCFTFVRNPYQRILSAYVQKIEKGKGLLIKDNLKNNEDMIWENVDLDNLSFKNFVDVISKSNIHEMDPHWKPQYMLLNFKYIQYHFIGRVENYEDGINKLFSTILKDKLKPPHNLNTKSREKLHRYYTPDLVDKVYKIYKDDFEILGYSKDIDQIDQHDDSKLPQLPLKKTIPIPNRLRVKLIRQRINILKSTLKDTTKELIHS